jgi:hypothetical protein
MRSHFRISSSAAIACAVSGATALMTGVSSGQIIAFDSASNPTYSGGWSAGQNGGSGFGAWSFNGTDPTPAGTYQGISSASSLGTAWTVLANSSSTGLGNAGRSINGGLQAGQTFQAIIQNPINNAGIYTYRGFDILFTSGTDNVAPGDNTSALRLQVFDYFNPSMNFGISDGTGSHPTGVSAITTGASGMILDLIVGQGNAYALTLAPQSNPNSPYLTQTGTLASSIDYVDFRNYNATSGGLNDPGNNISISTMEVIVPEPSALALGGLGAMSFMLVRRRK